MLQIYDDSLLPACFSRTTLIPRRCSPALVYYRNEGGPIVLVEANPKKYVECGRFPQPDRSDDSAWPHPVIANGKLYIRDQDALLCYDVKQRWSAARLGRAGPRT